MSFITSYLGMNTNDVRNMELNQWIFWATAAPFTAVVVGVCMFIAYEGDKVREAVKEGWFNSRNYSQRTKSYR